MESISELDSNILIGNLSSSDKTLSICKKFKNVSILDLSGVKDLSKAKNKLIETNKASWIFFIEPWEFLIDDNELKKIAHSEVNSYKMNIIQNDVITKQIRLWHKDKKLKFKNPIYETIEDKHAKYSNVYIASNKPKDSNYLDLIEEWRNYKPLSSEPLYYLAFYHLEKKEWNKFLNYANLYLHQEKTKNLSLTMTHYYCSMVKCYIESEKNIKDSIYHLLYCLSENPLMAEFWCLLGDIYYSTNDYNKAIHFYENAIILGSKRLKNDNYPIEISKYKEYPEKMIKNCLEIKEQTRGFGSSKENQVH
jgi:tetratricopeptide (TPR) repeat protein